MLNYACLVRLSSLLAVSILGTTYALADSVVLVTSQANQASNDSISWHQLGGDQTVLAASFNAKSAGGSSESVSLAGPSSVVSLVCSSTPANCSWTGATGFAVGDSLVWTSNTGNGGNGPVKVTFSSAVAGAGALIQADIPGQFTAQIQAFDGATSLGSFTVTSDTNGDATYIGVKDDTAAHITSVTFALTTCAVTCTDFGIDTVYLNVAKSTSTSVVSSVNPSQFEEAVTFTATVTSNFGTPTGTVTFKDGTTTLGTGTLSSGKATFKTSTLSVGAHSITAVYGGSTDFAGSTSSPLTQTVKAAATTTSLASSLNPSTSGQAVTFTATVTSSGGTPTGTVTFKDGTTTLGTGTLSSGKTTFKTSTLSVATHHITAVYGGSADFAGSTSAVLNQVVNP